MKVHRAVATVVLLSMAAVICTASSLPPLVFPYAPRLDVQSAAERIVATFASSLPPLVSVPQATPTIVIRSTPYLAYHDHRTESIVLAYWPTLDPASRSFFLDLTETETEAASLFVALCNDFLVAHELAHWIQRALGADLDRYGAEQNANEIAVAYFMTVDEGEPRLVTLRSQLDDALRRLPDPTPLGWAERPYFNDHYGELIGDPRAYGYYQLRFILDAIDRRDQLDFRSLVLDLVGR